MIIIEYYTCLVSFEMSQCDSHFQISKTKGNKQEFRYNMHTVLKKCNL